jgi:hypothetical protein
MLYELEQEFIPSRETLGFLPSFENLRGEDLSIPSTPSFPDVQLLRFGHGASLSWPDWHRVKGAYAAGDHKFFLHTTGIPFPPNESELGEFSLFLIDILPSHNLEIGGAV